MVNNYSVSQNESQGSKIGLKPEKHGIVEGRLSYNVIPQKLKQIK